MRYKPIPEKRKPSLHPIWVDATDLEYLLELAGDGSTLEIETPRCEYSSPEDLLKHLHWRARLTKLSIRLGGDGRNSIMIVPAFVPIGERAEEVAPSIKKFLWDFRRRRIRRWAIAFSVVPAYVTAVVTTVQSHAAAHVLEPRDFNPFQPMAIAGLVYPLIAYILASVASDVVVPRRRDGSFARQHMPALIIATVTAIITAVVTALVTSV